MNPVGNEPRQFGLKFKRICKVAMDLNWFGIDRMLWNCAS